MASVSLQPLGLWPTRLFCPQDFPGKNTGLGCHFLLQRSLHPQALNLHLLNFLQWQGDSLPLSHLGSLTSYPRGNSWGCKESDTTEWLHSLQIKSESGYNFSIYSVGSILTLGNLCSGELFNPWPLFPYSHHMNLSSALCSLKSFKHILAAIYILNGIPQDQTTGRTQWSDPCVCDSYAAVTHDHLSWRLK